MVTVKIEIGEVREEVVEKPNPKYKLAYLLDLLCYEFAVLEESVDFCYDEEIAHFLSLQFFLFDVQKFDFWMLLNSQFLEKGVGLQNEADYHESFDVFGDEILIFLGSYLNF